MSKEKKPDVWQDVELVKSAIRNSSTTKELLIQLGLSLSGTDYRKAKNFAAEHAITLPHITDAERLARSISTRKQLRLPVDEIFRVNSLSGRQIVKLRALQEGLLEYRCYGKVCNGSDDLISNWDGLVLQLEHKNGIGDDNRIENIELLCPNCHSMTETFGSGNKKRYENGAHGCCEDCGRKSIYKKCLRCSPVRKDLLKNVSLESIANDISIRGIEAVAKHYSLTDYELRRTLRKRTAKIIEAVGVAQLRRNGTIDYPPIEELIPRIEKEGYSKVSREVGVSDGGLRKHVRKEATREVIGKFDHNKKK